VWKQVHSSVGIEDKCDCIMSYIPCDQAFGLFSINCDGDFIHTHTHTHTYIYVYIWREREISYINEVIYAYSYVCV
jgi:hypothetical protein